MNVLTENLVLKRSRAESLEAVKNLNCWGCDLHDVRMIDSQSMFVCTLTTNYKTFSTLA